LQFSNTKKKQKTKFQIARCGKLATLQCASRRNGNGLWLSGGCKKFKSQDLIVAEKLPETLALSS
jgi:hypothetical protein